MAGTSIELLLSRFCAEGDVITPLGFDPDAEVRMKHKAKEPQNYFRSKPLKHWQLNELFWLVIKGIVPNLNYWEHLPAGSIKAYIGDELWNKYLKISVVRNPWSHAVSWYKWQEKYNFENAKGKSFEWFLLNNYRNVWEYYSINEIYSIDVMIRFEHLEDDLKLLGAKIEGIEISDIPQTKKRTGKRVAYQDYYTKTEMIERVRQRNLHVIEKFNYRFDGK